MSKEIKKAPVAAAAAGDTTAKAAPVVDAPANTEDALRAQISELEGDLQTANAQLGEKSAYADRLEGEIDVRDEQIANLMVENLALKQASADKEPAPAAEATGTPKTHFEYQGRKYAFTPKTPARLDVDGVVYSQEDLYNNEEAMTSLIVGENAFLKQVF